MGKPEVSNTLRILLMCAKLEELREPQMCTYSNLLWSKEQSPLNGGVFYKRGVVVFFPIWSFPEVFP